MTRPDAKAGAALANAMTRWCELRVALGVVGAASLATAIVAWPVLRSPHTRIFGNEIVGRHHDPFTVMHQFQNGGVGAAYWQPVTDQLGAVLASGVGPVAAYNVIVLLSIPLSAGLAYALGRFLGISRLGSSVAAFAYAFAPIHLAHAGYHAHIAQTQWLPLFLLALWACLDRPSVRRGALLVAAGACLAASSFYNGLIALVVAPVALLAWRLMPPVRPLDRKDWTAAGALLVTGILAVAYAAISAPDVWRAVNDYKVPRTDLFPHSAYWWAYLVPSVEHPLWGSVAARIWRSAGIDIGLLEQQVWVSWAVLAMAGLAVWHWWRNRRDCRLRWIPVLVVVGVWAWLCSLAPDGVIGGLTFTRPAAFVYAVLPMFRSYARFGVVVALMFALLAGMGAAWLVSRRAHWVLGGLLVVLFVDLMPLPWRYRDVLPTMGHRWLADQGGDVRALDCGAPEPAEALVPWLMHYRLTLLSGSRSDCGEPRLSEQLSALGYTHVLTRIHPSPGGDRVLPRAGFRLVRSFPDSRVLAVEAPKPAIVTLEMPGFYERERLGRDVWRWMGAAGWWRVNNTTSETLEAYLDIDLEALGQTRALKVESDGEAPLVCNVDPRRRRHTLGPFLLTPGEHMLAFKTLEPATVADTLLQNGDGRALSIRIFDWRWSARRQGSLDARLVRR
jgi:hypothetical protein